jgi:hypothetical protein
MHIGMGPRLGVGESCPARSEHTGSVPVLCKQCNSGGWRPIFPPDIIFDEQLHEKDVRSCSTVGEGTGDIASAAFAADTLWDREAERRTGCAAPARLLREIPTLISAGVKRPAGHDLPHPRRITCLD